MNDMVMFDSNLHFNEKMFYMSGCFGMGEESERTGDGQRHTRCIYDTKRSVK